MCHLAGIPGVFPSLVIAVVVPPCLGVREELTARRDFGHGVCEVFAQPAMQGGFS